MDVRQTDRRRKPVELARVKTKPMRALSLRETAAEWEAEWLANREKQKP